MSASARVTGGVLEYAPGWPQLTGITADLLFEGRKMVVTQYAERAHYGVQVAKVTVIIPDLIGPSVLQIDGQTEGPARGLPQVHRRESGARVHRRRDRRLVGRGRRDARRCASTCRWRASTRRGSRAVSSSPATASRWARASAPLAQVNGTIEFTESSVSAQNIAAQTLGGNVTMQLGHARRRGHGDGRGHDRRRPARAACGTAVRCRRCAARCRSGSPRPGARTAGRRSSSRRSPASRSTCRRRSRRRPTRAGRCGSSAVRWRTASGAPRDAARERDDVGRNALLSAEAVLRTEGGKIDDRACGRRTRRCRACSCRSARACSSSAT